MSLSFSFRKYDKFFIGHVMKLFFRVFEAGSFETRKALAVEVTAFNKKASAYYQKLHFT